jgi:hypothetical protein
MKWAVVAAVIAVVAWFVWDREFSREARIERAYASCMKQFGGAGDAKSAAPAKAADATLADTLGKAMQDLVKGVTSSMSSAVCGGVRDACRADFDGAVCQNALAGFK